MNFPIKLWIFPARTSECEVQAVSFRERANLGVLYIKHELSSPVAHKKISEGTNVNSS